MSTHWLPHNKRPGSQSRLQPGCVSQLAPLSKLHGVALPSHWSSQKQPGWPMQLPEPLKLLQDRDEPEQLSL
jgi:hypothetical protein